MALTSFLPRSSCVICGKAASCNMARTIADLEGCPRAQQHHIMEAIGYRNLTI